MKGILSCWILRHLVALALQNAPKPRFMRRIPLPSRRLPIRKAGVALSDILAKRLPGRLTNQPSSNLMMEKIQLTAENNDLKAKIANLQGIAKEIRDLKRENTSLMAKLADRETKPKVKAEKAPKLIWKKEWAK